MSSDDWIINPEWVSQQALYSSLPPGSVLGFGAGGELAPQWIRAPKEEKKTTSSAKKTSSSAPITSETALPEERYPGDPLAVDLNDYGIPTTAPEATPIVNSQGVEVPSQNILFDEDGTIKDYTTGEILNWNGMPTDIVSIGYNTGLNPRQFLPYYDEIEAGMYYYPPGSILDGV